MHAQLTTLYARLKIPRLCRPQKISPIAMSSMFAPAHFSCSHSTHLTLTSSSSIPSSRTTSQVTLPINKHCATPPKEESDPSSKTTTSTPRGWLQSGLMCLVFQSTRKEKENMKTNQRIEKKQKRKIKKRKIKKKKNVTTDFKGLHSMDFREEQ